ncbi:MAG: MATE family efflux transporter [Bacillota bacterium]|nr:MATE family efflux transporter [Candidatus Fermentithermobacillaceae bacterium]
MNRPDSVTDLVDDAQVDKTQLDETGVDETRVDEAHVDETRHQGLSLRERVRARPRYLDLENHTIEQNILVLALPLMAERILHALVNAADIAMVGRVGAAAVVAVGLSNQVSMIATGVYDAIRVGTTSVVARRIGAGQDDEAQRTLRQSLLVAVVIGTLAALLIGAFAGPSLKFMGAEPDVIQQGIPYAHWKGLSMLFQFITMTFTAALRGAGNTRLPMFSGMLVNITNVLGNYALIGGNWGFPAMGTEGAGLATAFAHFLGMIVVAALTIRQPNPISDFYKGSFLPHTDTLRSVLTVGLPASGERLSLRGAQLIYARAIAGLGTNAYAAHQVALRVESLSLVIGFSLGVASTTLVGQYLGYGDTDKAEEAALKCGKIAAIMMGCTGVALFLTAPFVVKLFVPDNPEVMALGATVLRIVAVAQPVMGMNQVFAGGLRGAGDTAWTMLITGSSAWVVRVGLTYMFVGLLGLHLPGAWYAMVIDLFVRCYLFRRRFKAGHWKQIMV